MLFALCLRNLVYSELSATNLTLQDEAGTPEFEFTISVSSTGGKVFTRGVGDREESNKLTEGVRLDLRRALRKFDKHVQFVIDKYKLQIK